MIKYTIGIGEKMKIILVDGNSLMFRSYYATAYSGNLMKNKHGIYTNAIFGFCNMIAKLQEEEKTHFFVAFDKGKETLRHQAYDEYKGTRKKLPDELLMQIPYVKRYLDVMNIKHYEMSDYEADDIIATLATMAQQANFSEIKIVTGDKDLLQLVGGNIKVCITRKGASELEEFNKDNFFEKMGITPAQIRDYKGLVGDSSDNLPGIKGIGEVTAIKLLKEYQTLENIIANVDNIKGKAHSAIIEGSQMGLTCKHLATLYTNIHLEFGLEETIVRTYDSERLVEFYKELDFTSFIERLAIKTTVDNANIEIVDAQYDFSNCEDMNVILETFGENYYSASILGLAIVCKEKNLFVKSEVIKENKSLKACLERAKISTFDYKKLYVVLRRLGINIKKVDYDFLIAAYLINPNYADNDFKKVAQNFVTSNINFDSSVYGIKAKAKIPDLDVYSQHAVSKALLLPKLKKITLEKLNELDVLRLFSEELELSYVLGNMELSGLKVDRNKLKEVEKELLLQQSQIEKKIYNLANCEFNINSVKQLGEVLFDKLGLPHGKKNKTGFSTNSEVLEKLAGKYEIASLVLEYRAITKIINTYVNGLFTLMDDHAFVHPLYNQALTVTGRLSSQEPNIQNIPIRTELGQVIREVFTSRFTNGVIMSSDYSQIELRVLAHIAQDEKMIAMFENHVDFHKQTASKIYDIPLEEVTKEQRRAAKAINFGIIYGMSAWGLSESIGINPNDASIYIEKYFQTFHKVKEYLDNVVLEAKKDGYTKTIFNRRRYIPEINSTNKALASFGERTAMNSPIQGSAADIIKLAMNKVSKRMQGMKSVMIAQVHDELLFDVDENEVLKLEQIVKEEMENVVKLLVPLVVEIGTGKNWLEA